MLCYTPDYVARNMRVKEHIYSPVSCTTSTVGFGDNIFVYVKRMHITKQDIFNVILLRLLSLPYASELFRPGPYYNLQRQLKSALSLLFKNPFGKHKVRHWNLCTRLHVNFLLVSLPSPSSILFYCIIFCKHKPPITFFKDIIYFEISDSLTQLEHFREQHFSWHYSKITSGI